MNSICAFPNDINIGVCLNKLKTDKKYKEKTLKQIVSTFCALLNSHGGRATLKLESYSTSNYVKDLKRVIEQRLSDILGFSAMRDHVNIVSSSSDESVYNVEEISSLCTVNYNLYIPTETQFLVLPSKTSIADVKEILSSKNRIVEVEELVEIGTHYKEFVFQQNISDQPRESKTVQFKNLKAEKTKCVTLGDRMTNKPNRFPNYVSGFANGHGGHIYYGVDDDGVVKGEVVKDKEEITKKVSKAINKMVWPTECGGPKREQHWGIFFEPVNDNANGNVVPFTFVIVIYVARCAGGVFTEEPESYHIVKGEVKKIEFEEWRRRLFLDAVPQNVARAKWSSRKMEFFINSLIEKMDCLRNSGGKEAFLRFVMQAKEKYPSSEVRLTILLLEAASASRRNELVKAEKLIEEYISILHNNSGDNKNFMLFMVAKALIKSTKERSAGNYKESYELATSGLQNVEFVPPGLYSAWLYLQAASLLTTLAYDRDCQDRFDKVALAKKFDEKALEHVSYVSGFSNIVADVRQNTYIHIASLYLACSRTGTIDITAVVSQDDITRGMNCLMMVDKLVVDGYPLSSLRQIQYFLAQSSLFLRHSQQLSTTTQQSRRSLLEYSFQYSEKALKLAIECHFGEMVLYSRQHIAYVTEEIVRESVRDLRLKKTELVEES